MEFNNIDWIATSKLILGILTLIFGVNWTINRKNIFTKNNVVINGNNNSTNIADRDINNVRK